MNDETPKQSWDPKDWTLSEAQSATGARSVPDKPYDVITLNKVTFNLADRLQRMEDAMINIVRLQLFLEESISVLEAKVDPPRDSEIN